jgi:uncharacterized membrane protein HdeD (DUF308 family)
MVADTMLGDALRQQYRRTQWRLIIRGLLALAIGIFLISRPIASALVLALVIAIWALVHGITDIVHAFDLRPLFRGWWVLLVGGLAGVVFGVLALYYYPALPLILVVVLFGLWLFISGIFGVYQAVEEKRAGLPWGWSLTWGLLSVIVGVAALIYQGITLAAVLVLIAVFAIASGVVQLVAAFRLRSVARDVAATVRRP